MTQLLPSKDDCGVFGVVRKATSPKISSTDVINAMECIRFRGSNLGAGFASFNVGNESPQYKLKAFIDKPETHQYIKKRLEEFDISINSEDEPLWSNGRLFTSWISNVSSHDKKLSLALNTINSELIMGEKVRGRFYSSGKFVEVFKDVGYPIDVARLSGLVKNPRDADMWVAHTRQPTNSPGMLPIWSHPFSSFEVAIVHNGDISSFGANIQFLNSRGVKNLVGTDSEVIAYIVDYLIRVMGLSMEDVGQILSNPYDKFLDRLDGNKASSIRQLIRRFRGAELDGPFTVVSGYSDGSDAYLLGLIDRSKFRPIVVGEDENNIYMASEECQIRLLSPNATVWTPKPGRFVLASMRNGIMNAGREHKELFFNSSSGSTNVQQIMVSKGNTPEFIDASGLDYHELNSKIERRFEQGEKNIHLINVNGQRYLGFNMPMGSKLIIDGIAGNCLANFNKGGEVIVHGNAEDNVGDVMYKGRLIIHGDARDVLGQAFQGDKIFVKGNVGNRAAIQMREYRDKKPVIVIGGRADDYFGEYMAGGIAMVLGLESIGKEYKGQLVGEFVATGMLGGTMYIRSRVRGDSIGLSPPRIDVLNYVESLVLDGLVQLDDFEKVKEINDMTLDNLGTILPIEVVQQVKRLYKSKYTAPLNVEYRYLSEQDKVLIDPILKEFSAEFDLNPETYKQVMNDKYTIISTKDSAGKESKPQVKEAEE